MLAGYCVKLAMTVILYTYMYSVNKMRDREVARGQGLSEEKEKEAIELGYMMSPRSIIRDLDIFSRWVKK